ncbi:MULTISPECIES: DUF4435 domain-containing protein [unclassified Pseudomonas]|uniref:DUF4435 domain-containing protein n=2 Tax=Pseudomonas TaxID=286 RepID=UPI0015A0F3C9|nr:MULTISPECIES: DUF4435 domain-containing protein [unclassified Pseudomonas]NWC91497.1 DUF4435 domain-containing protein [Pseudomonas sp. IPO3779]NWD17661.1 DUF4435 domain-containing protein [Pseudomonas sp. IPO3778]
MERSAAAKYAASVFYEGFNDFDIYVEDTAPGYTKIFASILSRAISNNVTLEKIFALGERSNVLDAANKRLSSDSERKAVYIVDGDLFLLAGEREPLPKNVIALPRYCIENFLIDESTLISIMDEEHCSITQDELARRFDYSGWISRSTPILTSLFRTFAAAHYLRAGIPTVARGYTSVYMGDNGELNIEKAKQTEQEVINLLTEKYGTREVNLALQHVDDKIEHDKCFITTYVSAKDFTLPLLMIRVRALTETKAKNINLKMRISKNCSLEPFSDVVNSIKIIIGTPNFPHN